MKNRIMKKIWTSVLFGIMAISMAGCGDPVSKESTDSQAEKESEAERPYYVRDPSKVTGTVTIYGSYLESQKEAFEELWNKYYPNCEIEMQIDSIGTVVTKVRSDENTDVDVICGGFFATDGDSYHDILQPYTPACQEEILYTDTDGYYTYFDAQVMCLVVNNAELKKLEIGIKGYEDLLQPELEGKIILTDPSSTSSGYRHLETILAVMGNEFADDKAWDYVKNLGKAAYSTNSSSDVYNLVQTGEYVAGLSYESGITSLIEDGADVSIIYMEEGNTVVAGGAGMVKDCKNQEAAQAVLDLLSSAEFQTIRDEVSQARAANKNADVFDLPDQGTLNIVEMDYGYLAENKTELLNKWSDIFTQ